MGIRYLSGGDVDEVQQSDLERLSGDLVDALFSGVDADRIRLKGKGAEEVREAVIYNMRKMISANGAVLAIDEEKVVGMEGYKILNVTDDGRPVIELSHVVVDSDYRGRKISARMYEKIFSDIFLKIPNPIIVANSREKTFLNLMERRGYEVGPLRPVYDLMGRKDGDDYVREMESIGFRGLIFDPKKGLDSEVEDYYSNSVFGFIRGFNS